MTKKIEVVTWEDEYTDPVTREKKTADMNTMKLIGVLINDKKPDELPKGWDNFRTFRRLAKAFDKAENNKILEIDDADYVFLKKIVEKDIPAKWAMIDKAWDAMEKFMEKDKEE